MECNKNVSYTPELHFYSGIWTRNEAKAKDYERMWKRGKWSSTALVTSMNQVMLVDMHKTSAILLVGCGSQRYAIRLVVTHKAQSITSDSTPICSANKLQCKNKKQCRQKIILDISYKMEQRQLDVYQLGYHVVGVSTVLNIGSIEVLHLLQ